MDEFCGSEFWNNNLTWYADDPDFTVCFQRTVLVWTPCPFLWIFMMLDIVYIKHSMNRNGPCGAINLSKLIITGALILLTIIDAYTAYTMNDSKIIFPVDYYTPLIKILSFAVSGLLVYLNKRNGMQTSGVLFFFWFLLFLFSIPQFRSQIRRHSTRDRKGRIENFCHDYNLASFMLFFTMTTITFFLNCFADLEPLQTKYPKSKNPCPEMHSNFVSKLFFSSFDKMAWKGYKTPLKQTDLWSLKPQDRTTEVIQAFTKHWKPSSKRKIKNSTKEQSSVSILPALWKTFGGQFLFGWLLKLAVDVITFMLPQLLGLTIDFIDASKGDKRPEFWKGLMYSFLLFIVASLQTLLFTQFFHRMYTVGFRIRTALISVIYRKALVVSNATRKQSTVGEITNLMSIDAGRFTEIMLTIDLVWSAPLQIAIAMYFLWSMLGPSVLAGLAVMIISMPITGVMLIMMRKYFTKQMANKDERIKMMNEILNGIKVLKLYAWENSFQKLVNKIRDKEVKTLRKTAFLET